MENRAKQAIKRLALEKGVTEEQLIAEMEEAIREGWRRSRQTGNTEALKIWESIPKKGAADDGHHHFGD